MSCILILYLSLSQALHIQVCSIGKKGFNTSKGVKGERQNSAVKTAEGH